MAFAHGQTDIIGISSMVIPSLLPPFWELCSSERAKWELYVDSTLHTCLLNRECMDTPNCTIQNALQAAPLSRPSIAPRYIEFIPDAGNRLFIVVYDQSERAIFTQH